jgi:glycosyltransferase involved in cell wall biosynthesis
VYRLAIVIPTYNETARLPGTLAAIAATSLPGVEITSILLADNGSTDDTCALGERLGRELGLPLLALRLPVRGKARALRAAMPTAAGLPVDGILFMDADNATPLSALNRFPLAAPAAILIASRRVPGATISSQTAESRSRGRELLSGLSRLLTRLLLGLPETDTQCGFKLVPRIWAGPLFAALRSDGWMIDAELLARAHQAGLPVREIAVDWTDMAGSKVRPGKDALLSLLGLLRIFGWLTADRIRCRYLVLPSV